MFAQPQKLSFQSPGIQTGTLEHPHSGNNLPIEAVLPLVLLTLKFSAVLLIVNESYLHLSDHWAPIHLDVVLLPLL